jgi:hypothetical protein
MAKVKVERGDANYSWIDYCVETPGLLEVLYKVKPSKRITSFGVEIEVNHNVVWTNNLIGVALV